ncbi:MAG: DUF4175 family protein [Bacteroidota bacterium]
MAVIGVGFLIATGAEAALWLGVELRTAMFWLLASILVALAVAMVGAPMLRGLGVLPGLGERDVVRRAGQDFDGVDDRLATFLDLSDRHASGDGNKLHAAAVDRLGAEVAEVPFERVNVYGPARRAAPWAFVPAVLIGGAILLAPQTMGAAAARLLSPGEYFAPPAPFQLAVDPGDAEVTRGAAFTVGVQATGRSVPFTADLEYGRADEDATETVRLTAADGASDAASAFTHTIEDVRADLRYRISAGGVRTPWYDVRAVDRPLVRGIRVTVVPPGYSGRQARPQPEGVGDATGLVGSSVRVQVGHGGPTPAEAWLDVRWDSGQRQRVPLRVGSEAALGQFRLRGAGTYSVRLKAASGLENQNPAEYALGVLTDAPPQIALVAGAEDALDASSRQLVFRITDDFGFRGGALVYRLTREGATGPVRSLRLPVRTRPLDQEVTLDWRVPGARPGDLVELYGRVTDNDGAGGKTARTPLVTLRFPSVSDRLDALDAQRDSTTETLDRIQEEAEQSSERFERLREDIRETQTPDFENRRQVEELLREQQTLQDQARQLQEQVNRLGDQIRDELGSPELQRQFEDMQQALDELNTPELRNALERLRDAMEELDLRDMLEQSDEAARSEEELRRRIERARELMKRLEAAVEMEEIARRAEDLAETEERLAEETEALDEGEAPEDGRTEAEERQRLADEQREAAEQAEGLQEQMDALREQMEDIRNAQTESLDEMREQMQQDGGLPQQMEENAQQIEQNQLQEAQEGQQQMSEQLREMAEGMREQSMQMQGEQVQIDMAALRRALEDVLTISREQEALATRVRTIPNQNPALVPAARRQGELRDALTTVVDTLRRVSQTVAGLTSVIDAKARDSREQMDEAVRRLADRRSAPAASHQRTAMSSLNELAVLLADLLDQLQNQQNQQGSGSGGTGQSQQMQEMARQQAQLNQRIQQMLNESAGERLSPDNGRRLRQMAEQQERLRRQLQRALDSGGAGLHPDDRSALERIEEQMSEAAEQLRNGQLNNRTTPRQQQILERLLETERSVNQRGREEQRQGETGETRSAPPTSAPNAGRPAERIRADLIRALESGYTPDYQELIKRYFERLQARTVG